MKEFFKSIGESVPDSLHTEAYNSLFKKWNLLKADIADKVEDVKHTESLNNTLNNLKGNLLDIEDKVIK
ncbi:hypothetical protein L0B53_04455 [Vibrio sp. SS-MA-C1-2]|uniref:hypothetical protein n=1 Tax=Vibrio sp. SS-MA-C1-2 TaxID=2908646 RepID=UPI001F2C39B4|nr:hypothetical protein [Vibrio sp. SS-MA-C1-2]UJF17172.1 hypothetical protein L0B53_04455 [Vibrio sp. SS-MA-C1-2]